jgi:outer membrane protein OmpA-like peptidoglycan-associated protein
MRIGYHSGGAMMKRLVLLGFAAVLPLAGTGAIAQPIGRSAVLDLSPRAAVRAEVERRYEAALQATRSSEIVKANDNRYTWASEAKVACGIAIGYLKSGTVDEDSINRCDYFSARMNMAEAPVSIAAAPMTAPACRVSLPISIYFDWNRDIPPPDTSSKIAETASAMAACGWSGLLLIGHADRSGSDQYNYALSQRRAQNVANLFSGAGTSVGTIAIDARGEGDPAIETADGVREPMNRRVEITSTSRSK